MTEGNDFSGVIGGKGYALFMEAFPHFTEFQRTIARTLGMNLKGRGVYSRVLEAGCGPGPTTDYLLRINPLIDVTAVDKEPQMIAEARNNLSGYSDRVDIVQADILDYLAEIDSESFDGFVSGWTLHNLHSKRRSDLLPLIHRVLRPGGVFVNGDKYKQENEHQHQKDYDWSIDALRGVCEERGEDEWFEEWKRHMEYDERPEIVMGERSSLEEMGKVGFKAPRVIWRRHMEAIVLAKK